MFLIQNEITIKYDRFLTVYRNAVEGNSFNELFTASHIYLALTVFPLRSVLQLYIRVIQYLLHLKFVAPKGYAKRYLKRFIFL